jgi:hypothetical protein
MMLARASASGPAPNALDRSTALLRIGVGALALLGWFDFWPLLALHFSSEGWYTSETAGRATTGWFLAAPSYPVLAAFYFLTAGALGCFCLGLRPRLSGSVGLLGMSALYLRNPLPFDADDEVLRSTIFLLLFARTSACWSLDAFLGRTLGVNASWPLALIRFKVAFLYLASGIEKLTGQSWADGTAISLSLSNPAYARFASPPAPEPALAIASLGLPYFEAALGLLLLIPKTRTLGIVLGLGFEAALAMCMDLRWFPCIMAVQFLAFAQGGSRGARAPR